ncbi:MAG: class I SAM-dependent methyltransferase [Myxococcales bacterium]|nr:class I SAM-dependent methyltransferase [Myxococcales bacterium]
MMNNSAYQNLKQNHIDNDTKEIANKYLNRPHMGTSFLGYRDIPQLATKNARGKRALDYGAGCGYSSQLLYQSGFQVEATDISDNMLELARAKYSNIIFKKAQLGNVPYESNTFDLVLSTFVLFDIPSKDELIVYLKEAHRVLKKDGIFMAITASEIFHLNNWKTISHDISKNNNIQVGETYQAHLIDANITFVDFFYDHKCYLECFKRANFRIIETHHPKGKESDEIEWGNELYMAPYVTYVCTPDR